ncbi:GGDEF domain-containing protein [Aurantimonas coralicida]|uniref:GGDEF domain-containing protein n=1 Tax=Aurantimonas coralicida TaxID=182270 RepID=UPI002384C7D1|nr:GGDEF domain-containing protein [Aurantimonas coralicida]MDE0921524.1 GGDEF domain-containing protein [Aurantimonas coralicida]
MLRHTEPVEVYKALVSALADNLLPTASIGVTFFIIGFYAYLETGAVAALAITVFGVAASLGKALFILVHRRTIAGPTPALADFRKVEAGHAITSWCMAAPMGALGAFLFSHPDLSLHIVATALLFGYCAGVATRISVRPRIATGAALLAAGPAIVSAAFYIEDARLLTGAVFLVFLISALETIAHLHRSACRLITMRLQMATLARRDPLTELFNRLGLRKAFDALAREDRSRVAVHVFDLDGFKAVNDTFGHGVGDRLLEQVASRLRRIAGEGDIVARIGGDEFVVVQPGIEDPAAPDRLAQRIHAGLSEAYRIDGGQEIRVGLSLGYSIASSDTASLDALLRDADATSYAVKRDGGGFRPHRQGARNMPKTLPTDAMATGPQVVATV